MVDRAGAGRDARRGIARELLDRQRDRRVHGLGEIAVGLAGRAAASP
jgi:hypothetical protein